MTTPQEAAAIAEELLAHELPRRWAHTQGVARTAREIAYLAGPDAVLLEAAAWLHDIGYSSTAARTGFHPLDGARYLDALGVRPQLVSLVALHTNAVVEAEERSMQEALTEFAGNDRPGVPQLHALLAFCDLTTNPDGAPVTFDERITDIYARYPQGTVVHRAIARSETTMRRQVKETLRAIEPFSTGQTGP